MGHTTPNMLLQVYQHVSELLEKEANHIISGLFETDEKEEQEGTMG